MIELTARCMTPDACPFAAGTFCENPQCATESDEVSRPCSVTGHEKKLRLLECCVSGTRPVTLHHCRGGSMATNPFGTPGAGQRQNDGLQIPLSVNLHYGQQGIDGRIKGGVKSWEAMYGLQVSYLASTSRLLQYSVWTLAWSWASPLVRRRVECFLRESRSRCLLP